MRAYNTPSFIENAESIVGRIESESPLAGSEVVLDFGCGTGLVGLKLLDKVAKVYFLDPSKGMLDVLREDIKKVSRDNYEIIEGKINDYTGTKVDIIVCSLVMHHADGVDEIIKGFRKIIKPGGKIFFVELKNDEKGPYCDPENLSKMLKKEGFNNFDFSDFGQITIVNRTTGALYVRNKYFVTVIND